MKIGYQTLVKVGGMELRRLVGQKRPYIWSSGLKWRGENHLLFIRLAGFDFFIRKPKWLWNYQAELDGRYYSNA